MAGIHEVDAVCFTRLTEATAAIRFRLRPLFPDGRTRGAMADPAIGIDEEETVDTLMWAAKKSAFLSVH